MISIQSPSPGEGPSSEVSRGSSPRWRVWVLASVFAIWGILVTLLVLKIAGQTADDFFITYRYAQNLLAGNGFVFNPGERVFGTTAPGWGLLLALGSWLTGVGIPNLGTLGAGLALLAVAVTLVTTGAGRYRLWEAAAAGSLVLTATYFWVHNGSEAFATMALLVFAARASSWSGRGGGGARHFEGRYLETIAGLAAGFCVWMRPEALVAVGLLGLLLIWQERRFPLRYALAAGVTIAIGLVLAAVYFGSPLPNTLGAKRLQAEWLPGTWSGGWGFWKQGWRWVSATYAGPFTVFLFAGGLVGHLSLLRSRDRALALLALFSLALSVAYPLLGVPFYTWYLIPMLFASLYGLFFLAGDLLRWAGKRWFRTPATWAAALLAGVLVLPLSWHVSHRIAFGLQNFQGTPQIELYLLAGDWMRHNTPVDADVAHVEVGALAYASQRPVRDLLGLVSPESLKHVANHDLAGALREANPEFVGDLDRLRSLTAQVIEDPWFQETYAPVETFHAELSGDVLVLYRRQ